jgi:hypothetical protein
MTDAEVFHEETKQSGGRLDREILPDAANALFAEIEERASDLIETARRAMPLLPPIHFDFVFNGAINAVAFKSHNHYFIGLNTGTAFMLRFVIGRMLSDRRFFQFIGNPNDEDELEPLSGYSSDAEQMYEKEPLSIPNDNLRASYAWFLQDQAIMFFLGHEITHITHGHVDYLKAKRGADFATELEWFGKKKARRRIDRKAMFGNGC